MSNYLTLCQKLRELVGISGDGPASVLSQVGMNKKITTWIADADEWVIRRWEDWSFMLEPKTIITVAAGTSTYTLNDLSITDLARWRTTAFVRGPGAADYLLLESGLVYDDDYLTSEEYLGEAVTGPIEKVFVRSTDDALIFYPTPTVDTTVWGAYYKAATRMAANDSESPIPARFESVILNRAKMFYAEHLEDTVLYQSAEKDFIRDMHKLESKCAPALDGTQMSHNDVILDVVVE